MNTFDKMTAMIEANVHKYEGKSFYETTEIKNLLKALCIPHWTIRDHGDKIQSIRYFYDDDVGRYRYRLTLKKGWRFYVEEDDYTMFTCDSLDEISSHLCKMIDEDCYE